jgi:hypothetical protein
MTLAAALREGAARYLDELVGTDDGARPRSAVTAP